MVVRLHTPHLILLVEHSLVQEGLRRFDAVERDECVIHMSSGWFDCTKPFVRTYSQGEQGMFLRDYSFAFTPLPTRPSTPTVIIVTHAQSRAHLSQLKNRNRICWQQI